MNYVKKNGKLIKRRGENVEKEIFIIPGLPIGIVKIVDKLVISSIGAQNYMIDSDYYFFFS
jgi:hypothetical protein